MFPLAVTIQLTDAPLNRRDAKDAETDQSQSPENLSLKGHWLAQPLLLFSALFASLRFLSPRPD